MENHDFTSSLAFCLGGCGTHYCEECGECQGPSSCPYSTDQHKSPVKCQNPECISEATPHPTDIPCGPLTVEVLLCLKCLTLLNQPIIKEIL